MPAVKTQGTDAYILVPSLTNPGQCEVIDLGCVTSIDPGTDTSDQIETTCLKDTTRTYTAGLKTPGQGSIGLNADPQAAAHLRLFELSETQENIQFAVGWSDGKSVPTVAAGAGIASVTVTNGGTGYTAPTVAFTGGGGTGATGTVQQTGGVISGITITNPGTGYTSAPTVAITDTDGTGAAATATINASGCSFNLPLDRTFNVFEGYVSGFPFNFAANTVVQSNVSIQRSGSAFWYKKGRAA